MNTTSTIFRSQGALRRFSNNSRGNVAVIFAIAILPIVSLIGAAVDYSRLNSARTAMQTALDTTALMISKDVNGLTASQISQNAQTYFAALYNHPEAGSITIGAAYTPASGSNPAKVVLTGSGTLSTDFMKVAGYPSLGFNVGSTTTWGSTKLRVAMALDNTGSMANSGKMDALKTAAKNLITTLSASAQTDGDVLISIIPFATDVNVGTVFKTQPWMDWSQWSDNGQNREWLEMLHCGQLIAEENALRQRRQQRQ